MFLCPVADAATIDPINDGNSVEESMPVLTNSERLLEDIRFYSHDLSFEVENRAHNLDRSNQLILHES